MLAVIHHINSPKLKQYPSDVIGMAKNKIKQKEADMLTVVDDNLKNDERLQVVDALYSMYTGDIFLQKYNECLCEGINKAFDRQYKTITDADKGLFMKDTRCLYISQKMEWLVMTRYLQTAECMIVIG